MRDVAIATAAAVAVIATAVSDAAAGTQLSAVLGSPLGAGLPIVEFGMLGAVAAGVVGGVWAIRRKQ